MKVFGVFEVRDFQTPYLMCLYSDIRDAEEKASYLLKDVAHDGFDMDYEVLELEVIGSEE